MKKPAVALLAALAYGAAIAAPSIRPETVGSAINFWATNMEERGYNCSLVYTWSFDSFGEHKVQNANSSFQVPPKANNIQVVRLQGSYPNLQLDTWNVNCN